MLQNVAQTLRIVGSHELPNCIEDGNFLVSQMTVKFSRRTLLHGISYLLILHMALFLETFSSQICRYFFSI
jgi:hypothetical protein